MKICKDSAKKQLKKCPGKILRLVEKAAHICTSCCRVSNEPKTLCKPEELKKIGNKRKEKDSEQEKE